MKIEENNVHKNISKNYSFTNKHPSNPDYEIKNLMKNLTNKTLFLFSRENTFRKELLKLSTNFFFLTFVIIINLISSIFLILETVEDQKLLLISKIFFAFFLSIFLLEFLIKIISFGFVLDKNTYLRDPWNFLDFLILISGFISLFPEIQDHTIFFRIFRVIRPIKALSAIPHMRVFISALLYSLLDLSSVFMILLFSFIFFALIGLSLWSDVFNYRCRLNTIPLNGTLAIDQKYPYLCGGDNLCTDSLFCLSSKDFQNTKKYFLSNEKNNFQNELYTANLNYGMTNFRNFWSALYVVFQSTTLEGWSYIMYMIMSGHNYYFAAFYFIILIIINNYFMLNLLVAILLFNFEKNKEQTDEEDEDNNIFGVLKKLKSKIFDRKNTSLNINKNISSKLNKYNSVNNNNLYKKEEIENKENIFKHENSFNVFYKGKHNNNSSSRILIKDNKENLKTSANKGQVDILDNFRFNALQGNLMSSNNKIEEEISIFSGNNNPLNKTTPNKIPQFDKISDDSVLDKKYSNFSLLQNNKEIILNKNNNPLNLENKKNLSINNLENIDNSLLDNIKSLNKNDLKKNIFYNKNNLKITQNLTKINSLLHVIKKKDPKFDKKEFEENLKKYRKKYTKLKTPDKNLEIFQYNNSLINSLKKIPCFREFKRATYYHRENILAYISYCIINQPIIQYFLYFCIFFNFIILLVERKNQTQNEIYIIEIINKIFVGVYTIECIFSVLGTGIRNYFRKKMNIFDFIIVFISILEIILDNTDESATKKNISVVLSFKILRILRILRLVRSWHSFRVMTMSIIETVKKLGNYFILFIIFIYIYALIGYNLFNKSLKFNNDTQMYDKTADSLYDNFDTFMNSYLSVFYLIIGDGWYKTFFDCMRSQENNIYLTIIYFISLVLLGQISLVNIFLAYLIDNFKLSRRNFMKNFELREILRNFTNLGLQKHRIELIKFHQNNKYKSPIIALINYYANNGNLNETVIDSKIYFMGGSKINFNKTEKVYNTYFTRRINYEKTKEEKIYDKYYDFTFSELKKKNRKIDLELDAITDVFFWDFNVDKIKKISDLDNILAHVGNNLKRNKTFNVWKEKIFIVEENKIEEKITKKKTFAIKNYNKKSIFENLNDSNIDKINNINDSSMSFSFDKHNSKKKVSFFQNIQIIKNQGEESKKNPQRQNLKISENFSDKKNSFILENKKECEENKKYISFSSNIKDSDCNNVSNNRDRKIIKKIKFEEKRFEILKKRKIFKPILDYFEFPIKNNFIISEFHKEKNFDNKKNILLKNKTLVVENKKYIDTNKDEFDYDLEINENFNHKETNNISSIGIKLNKKYKNYNINIDDVFEEINEIYLKKRNLKNRKYKNVFENLSFFKNEEKNNLILNEKNISIKINPLHNKKICKKSFTNNNININFINKKSILENNKENIKENSFQSYHESKALPLDSNDSSEEGSVLSESYKILTNTHGKDSKIKNISLLINNNQNSKVKKLFTQKLNGVYKLENDFNSNFILENKIIKNKKSFIKEIINSKSKNKDNLYLEKNIEFKSSIFLRKNLKLQKICDFINNNKDNLKVFTHEEKFYLKNLPRKKNISKFLINSNFNQNENFHKNFFTNDLNLLEKLDHIYLIEIEPEKNAIKKEQEQKYFNTEANIISPSKNLNKKYLNIFPSDYSDEILIDIGRNNQRLSHKDVKPLNLSFYSSKSFDVTQKSEEEFFSDYNTIEKKNEEITIRDLFQEKFDLIKAININDTYYNNEGIFFKEENIFFKITQKKSFFEEFNYEKKIFRERMSIHNLLNNFLPEQEDSSYNTVMNIIKNNKKKIITKSLDNIEDVYLEINNSDYFLKTENSQKKNKININNLSVSSLTKEETKSLYKNFFFKISLKNSLYSSELHKEKPEKIKQYSKTSINKYKFELLLLKIKEKNLNKKIEEKKCSNCFVNIKNYILNSSLGIFHKNWKFRLFLAKIVTSNYFEFFIMVCIILNCVFIILNNPWNDPNGIITKSVNFSNYVFTFIFLAESIIKIIAFGLFFGQKNVVKYFNVENKFSENFFTRFNNSKSSVNLLRRRKFSELNLLNFQKERLLSNKNLLKLENFTSLVKNNENNILKKTKTRNILNFQNLNDNESKQLKNPNQRKNAFIINNPSENIKNEQEILNNKTTKKNPENKISTDDLNSSFTTDSSDNTISKNKNSNTINLSLYSGYLSNLYNLLDFVIIFFGSIDILGSETIIPSDYLKIIRMLRSIRPIRIVTKSENLKNIITCLFNSIPAIANILIIGGIFILIYAVMGVYLFKNSLNFFCLGDYSIITEVECIKNNMSWIYNEENFIHIFKALRTLFEVMTTQNWVSLMNIAFLITKGYYVYFYFISFIIFGYLFLLNLFITVIVEKFKYLKDKKNKLFALSEEEKDWIKVQKIMLNFNPKLIINEEDCSYLQNLIFKIISDYKFEILTSFFILSAIVLSAIQHDNSTDDYVNILTLLNNITTIFFNVELLLRIFVYRRNYFKIGWNIFDFIIILICNIVLILGFLEKNEIINSTTKLSHIPGIFRALRIFRILRLITINSNIRSIIDTLVYLIPSILNIGLIMVILIIIYGCIGVNLFSTVPFRESIHEYNNFRSFLSSIILLFRVTTGDDWTGIMNELAYHECTGNNTYMSSNSSYTDSIIDKKYDYFCVNYNKIFCYLNENISYADLTNEKGFSCGSSFSSFYFISFIIIGPIFVMNLCIVMVVEGFSESTIENESLLSQNEMDNFISVWMNYDTKFNKVVKPYEMVLILKQLFPPLGLNYDRYFISDPIRSGNKFIVKEKIRKDLKQLKNKKNFVKIEIEKNLNKENKNSIDLLEEKNIEMKNFNLEDKIILGNKINLEKLEKEKNSKIKFCMKNYKKINNSFDCVYYFFSPDLKYWTFNSEVIQIIDFFGFKAFEKISEEKEINERNKLYNGLNIHFVDACLGVSKYITSKKHLIYHEALREKIVRKFTKNLWRKKYNLEDEFNKNEFVKENFLSEKLSLRILSKIKPRLKNLLDNARHNLFLKKLNENNS